MNKLAIVLPVLLLATLPAQVQDITGDWEGTLRVGSTQLRMVLHVNRTGDGQVNAVLDSIDQDANGIPVTSIFVQNSELRFTVAAVKGSYLGKVNSDGTEIVGTWSQPEPIPLEFKRLASNEEHETGLAEIDGTWVGTLVAGVLELKMILRMQTVGSRVLATLESPEENARKIPVREVKRAGSSLTLDLKQLDSRFEGTISKDFKTISGTWTQNGVRWHLSLKRIENTEAQIRRPQDPIQPYPYREMDVSYRNAAADVTLAATLTLPLGKGPFPAVVLITGSGPQDRDEAMMGHRPFLVIADYLTRRGIAVLRADDRGTGQSTGDFSQATTADFATDVEAGLAYLRTRREIDRRKIGLIGHSEGGIIASMVAARNPHVAFIILMAGPGVSGEEILLAQNELITEASGTTHDLARKDTANLRELLELVKQNTDEPTLNTKLQAKLATMMPEALIDREIEQMSSRWFRYFLAYDPADALRKVSCPVLAINGEKDLQVPPSQNLPAIRKALQEGGNTDFEVAELPGLNHLFQTAKTGLPSEYPEIEETISPLALNKTAGWISRHLHGKEHSTQPSGVLRSN